MPVDQPVDLTAERLIGRSRELGELRQCLGSASSRGGFVVLRGAGGIGKTALLDAALADAKKLPAYVLRASTGPELTEVPLGAIRGALRRFLPEYDGVAELLRGLTPDSAYVLPEYAAAWSAAGGRPADAEELAGKTNQAICEIFRRLAHQQPVLVFLDDLQWADRPTLLLIRWMLRQLKDDRVLLIAALREDGDDLAHEPLAVAAAGTSIRVQPLSELEARRLLAESLPPGTALSVEEATSAIELAGRNPLFIIQAARAISENLPVSALADGLGSLMRARVRSLDLTVRRLLAATAVLGQEADVARVRELLEVTIEDIETALRGGLRVGLLQRDQATNSIQFSHAVAREAVLQELLPSELARLHSKALALLTSGSGTADPARLAFHAQGAGDSVALIRFADEAAIAAEQRGAFHESSNQFERLISALESSGETVPTDTLRRAARVWLAAGRAGRASAALFKLSERYRDEGDPHLEAVALCHSVRAQPSPESLSRLRAVVARLEGSGESAALAIALATLVHVQTGTLSAGNRSVVESSDRALGMARRSGSTEALAVALLARGHILANAFDFEAGCRLLEECVSLSTEPEASREEHAAVVNLTSLLTKAGRWDEAATHARAAANRALGRGAYRRAGQLLARLSDVEQWRGNWKSARAAAQEALLLVDGDDVQAARAARYAAAVCRVLEHDWGAAEALIAHELSGASEKLFPHAPFLALRARTQLGTGDEVGAVETGKRLHELWLRSSDAFYGIGFSEVFVASLCGAGDYRDAEAVFAQCERRLQWLPAELRPLPLAAIATMRAHLAGEESALSSARGFLEARERYRALGAPQHEARAAMAAAQSALSSGGPSERQVARESLTRAHELFSALGSPDSAASGALLRRMHWAMGTSRGVGLLSAREIEVALLVAEGMTNQEIAASLVVSARTVANHIARVFEKLDVHTRTALAREVRAGRLRDAPRTT